MDLTVNLPACLIKRHRKFCFLKRHGYLLIGVAVLSLVSVPGFSQRLEAVAISNSLAVTQTYTVAPVVFIGRYILATNTDRNRYDEIGYRLALMGRWRVGQAGWFGQPELGYTSTMGQRYSILTPNPAPFPPDDSGIGHGIKRFEVASLVGKHTGQHTYLLAGPVLAFNRRAQPIEVRPDTKDFDGIYNSLMQSVNRLQLLAQIGVGANFGRFDFNLRLEQSITPYTRQFTFDGVTYGYKQHIRQGLFTAGFALYKNRSATVLPAP